MRKDLLRLCLVSCGTSLWPSGPVTEDSNHRELTICEDLLPCCRVSSGALRSVEPLARPGAPRRDSWAGRLSIANDLLRCWRVSCARGELPMYNDLLRRRCVSYCIR